MKRNRVSVKVLTLILSAAFLGLTLLAGIFAWLLPGNPYEQSEKTVSASVESTDASEPQESSLEEEPPEAVSESSEEPEPEPEPSASEPDEEEAPPYTPTFNIPNELRGVMLSPGADYLTGDTLTPAVIASQIDQALAKAQELTMNTIVVDTKYQDSVLFPGTDLQSVEIGFDCVDYLITKAREMGFYVYAVYSVSDTADNGKYARAVSADGETLDRVTESVGLFAKSYKPDVILLDNYTNPATAQTYSQYLASGGGMGYENYLRRVPEALLRAAANAIRENAPDTQVGLFANAVWENLSEETPNGSETASPETDLGTGNVDTRALIADGLFDCVLVKNYGSTVEQEANFDTVAAWWSQLAQETGITVYMFHAADKVGAQLPGWTVYEQLTKQVIDLEKLSGTSGSGFNSLKALLANPGNSTTTLIQYMNDQINEQYVLTQLSLSKPDKLTFTTKEQSVTFQGASDPQEKVTLNGAEIPTNENGYFTIQEKLNPGANQFVIAHKNKSVTYNITREVDVLKEVQPVGNLTVDGGMEVRITALAYEGATVVASIGGQSITLTPGEDLEDEELRSSGYQLYEGSFTAPAASSSAVSLGTITVTASAEGFTKTLQGAAVTVNKQATLGEGGMIQVTADQAETFPLNTLDDTSSPSCYPLPKGTLDRTTGDAVVYNTVVNRQQKSYKYWKLQSGTRVYSDDIQAVSKSLSEDNTISNMKVKSSGQYTTVTLSTEEKVPYSVRYDGSSVAFTFQYTTSVPDSGSLKNNALFSSADWSGTTLTLRLKKTGGFLGYKAYYDGNDLVLRFNNAPGSLSGARIVVDPGHGGNDPGASGFYPGMDEADINLAISKKLVAELQSRGASVLMTSPGSTMASRMAAARAFNPQVLVSIHGNSSETNSRASGTEVYYFYPFAKQLAANLAANVSASLGSDNRGGKSGLYYMTRESQFAAVLVETGFVTNEAEYTKLINSKYQSRIAQGIANGISGYLGGINSGGGTGGTDDEEDDEENDPSENSGDTLQLNHTSLTLAPGDTASLRANLEDVEWESDDRDVARVSSSGKVTAEEPGETDIWAYSGDEKAKCHIRVTEDEDSGRAEITIDGASRMYIGDRETYEASVTGAEDDELIWWVDDNSILAIVNESDTSCRLEALESGETWLYAALRSDEDVEQRFQITVRD